MVKVGLALGGGSARGLAHLGIIDVLIEAGIRIDVVSGTSIGAIAGAGFAAGRHQEMKEFALSLDVRRLISLFELSLPVYGLIDGSRIAETFTRTIGVERIEDMDIPFCAVCCDTKTGERVLLKRGRLESALRASIAIPGMFKPVRIRGKVLVDGGLADPIPVRAAREMGADVVIAVDLNHYVLDRPEVKRGRLVTALERRVLGEYGIPDVFNTGLQSVFILMKNLSAANLRRDRPDVVLRPRIGDIGFLEYHRGREAIEMGRKCAAESLDPIRMAVPGQ